MRHDERCLSVQTAARLHAWSERTLSADEVRTRLDVPIAAAERDEVLSLVRWFRRRYPTSADRLAYVRRAYARLIRVRALLHDTGAPVDR